MGIPGLLKMLKPYTKPVHVNKYATKRVGIDAYCWLHKGAYACSFDVNEGDQKIAYMQPCVKYCMHLINMLRFNNVIPVLVFDGGRLPSKAVTENERHKRRELNLEQARLKLAEGDANGAQELFQRAVEITPLMAHELIKVLKVEGVEFVVAPYEADAQLAYLLSLTSEKGGVAAVISEDSDLLAYGCGVVIYKMDRYGNGEEVLLQEVMKKRTSREKPCDGLWFGCFTPELFTGMCVLAGCDFLASVPGIGIKRAHGLVCKYRVLPRVLSSMRFDRKLVVPEGYELAFKQAIAIFNHARIYDASARKLSFLKPLPAHFVNGFNGDLDFLGPDLPPSRALAIAEGCLDPVSMRAFDELPHVDLPLPAFLVPREAKSSTSVEKSDVSSSKVKGDVWLGTDEELFSFLESAREPEDLVGLLSSCVPALLPQVKRDNGFLVHLNFVASSANNERAKMSACLDEHHYPCPPDGAIVKLSPGKKRVLPPPPNNNPFKRGRMLDTSSTKPSKWPLLVDNELEEQVYSKGADAGVEGWSVPGHEPSNTTVNAPAAEEIKAAADFLRAADLVNLQPLSASLHGTNCEIQVYSGCEDASIVIASDVKECRNTRQPQMMMTPMVAENCNAKHHGVGLFSGQTPDDRRPDLFLKGCSSMPLDMPKKKPREMMARKQRTSSMASSASSLLKFFQRASTR